MKKRLQYLLYHAIVCGVLKDFLCGKVYSGRSRLMGSLDKF
jgi:hypothetical protein